MSGKVKQSHGWKYGMVLLSKFVDPSFKVEKHEITVIVEEGYILQCVE